MKQNPYGEMQFVPVKYSVTRLGAGSTQSGQTYPGGLDLLTPSLSLQPGALRDVLNFECAQSGGYARVDGYERCSGQPSPSAASYAIVQVDAFANTPSLGQTITQASSGATAVVIAVVPLGPYMVVTKTTGTFDGAGVITVTGPVTIGNNVNQTVNIGAQLDAQYVALAADNYRADISPPPGSGAILGVVGMVFNGADNVYAFRANLLGTAVNIWKFTPAGWSQVPLLNTVQFTLGGTGLSTAPSNPPLVINAGVTVKISPSLTVANPGGITVRGEIDVSTIGVIPGDGDTLIQGGVTALISRVQQQSGSWTGGTAAGQLVIGATSGGSFSAGIAVTSSGAIMAINGPSVPITISPGGRYEMVKGNFSGQLISRRIYGCDGINKGFEFDGTIYAPIATGLAQDSPEHIALHNGYLIFSKDASMIGCAPDLPYDWSAVDGAWEIATGDTVNAMLTLPGSQTTPTLGVYLGTNTAFLYGSSPLDFKFILFNQGLGAAPFSVQNLSDTFACDDLGVFTLKTTLNYGNFLPTTLTKNILPFITQQRQKLVDSTLNRGKSQYRIFYSDGYGLWMTMLNSNYIGASLVLFPDPVLCVDNGQTVQGTEVTYFGSSSGHVYQMDVGTSFDGTDIDAFITLAWNPIGSSRILKRYRAASIEIQGQSYAQIQFGYQLGYASALIAQPSPSTYSTGFQAGGTWDAFTWDDFFWDGQTLSPTDVPMTGTAENVQVTISSGSNYIGAYTLNSVIYHYTNRRGLRA